MVGAIAVETSRFHPLSCILANKRRKLVRTPDYNNHTVCADRLGRFFINLAVESSALLQTEDEPEKHISNEQDGKNGPYKFPRKLWDIVFGTDELKDDKRGGSR
jgi:hypothetical protein